MKSWKKIISVILVIMLISVQLMPIINVSAEETETLTITTYGENAEGINPSLVTNTANLFVNGVDNEQNGSDELSAYKIIDVFYNKTTNEMTYDFTSQFRTFLEQNEDYGETFTIDRYFELTSDPVDEYGNVINSVITTSTLNVLVSKYATYVRKNNIVGIDMITSGSFATKEVEAGAYLVLPKSIVTFSSLSSNEEGKRLEIGRNLYGVMVGNVVFEVDSTGNWVLPDKGIYAKKEDSIFDTMLFEFSTQQYSDFSNGVGTEDVSLFYQQDISSYVGRKHAFVLEIWNIPQFPTNAINKTATFSIQIPDGVSFDPNNINLLEYFGGPLAKVVDGKIIYENIEYGTVSVNGKELTITVVPDAFLLLTFDIWINDNSKVGLEGNKIQTTLTITDDPYVENSTTNLEIENTIYTYGLELTSFSKEDSQGNTSLLKGAKYEIYKKYDSNTTSLSEKMGEFTVGDDGKATFAGVPSGTIYLKQVKAPTGYQLIKEPIAVEIATEDAIAGTKEGYYQVITYNDAMWYLPSTGGIGTILYTVIGLLVIGLSAYAIVYYRKKKFN